MVAGLAEVARTHGLAASRLTAIGALSDAAVGFFVRESKQYKRLEIREQVEVLALTGDITLDPKGGPQVHAHVVLGKADATAHGGHLLEAHVWPTLEVIIEEAPAHLRRRHDPESGLALIELGANEAKEVRRV